MEKWRRVWRYGLVKALSRAGLHALRAGLARDDPCLIQGRISHPAPLDALRKRDALGACAIGYCGWRGEGLSTIGEVEDYFHRVCETADAAFHEPAACRYFLNWFDEAPREQMRRELLAEVDFALQARFSPLAA